MSDQPSDFDPTLDWRSVEQMLQRIDSALELDEFIRRGYSKADLIWILDRCPFVQITDALQKAQPLPEVDLVSSASSGWTIYNYGDAMSTSPGRLLFGGYYRDDDDEGSGGVQAHGTVVRQRYMAARDMVALTQQCGWGGIYLVDGHPKMMRDIWIEATRQDLSVMGYEPLADDYAVLSRVNMSADAMAIKQSSTPKG